MYGYNVWSGKEVEILIEWIDSKSTPPFMKREEIGSMDLDIMNNPYIATFYSFFKLSELEKKKLCKLVRGEAL